MLSPGSSERRLPWLIGGIPGLPRRAPTRLVIDHPFTHPTDDYPLLFLAKTILLSFRGRRETMASREVDGAIESRATTIIDLTLDDDAMDDAPVSFFASFALNPSSPFDYPRRISDGSLHIPVSTFLLHLFSAILMSASAFLKRSCLFLFVPFFFILRAIPVCTTFLNLICTLHTPGTTAITTRVTWGEQYTTYPDVT